LGCNKTHNSIVWRNPGLVEWDENFVDKIPLKDLHDRVRWRIGKFG
jgi:hypothetical protein